MPASKLQVVAIGDAIVDVIASCEDRFLVEHGLRKSPMQLLDGAAAESLYAAMGPAREMSGGSAANTMAGAAALGLETAFIGQVARDQLGKIFSHDIKALGVRFDTAPHEGGEPTSRCLILVTPDAQRTMSTCPGASHLLSVEAVDEGLIRSAEITFLEGYLWGPERPRAAMLHAARIARDAGRTVAFTLSESLCIAGRREGVMQMINAGMVDILFGNEAEMMLLAGSATLDAALQELSPKVRTLIATCSSDGAVGMEDGERITIPAAPAETVVDTTGAGDLFAAGFLAARCGRRPLKRCLEVGAAAAAEVITRFGARPDADLHAKVSI